MPVDFLNTFPKYPVSLNPVISAIHLWQRYLPAGGAGSGTHTTVLQYPFTRE